VNVLNHQVKHFHKHVLSLKNLLLLIIVIFKLKCGNLIFNEIMVLNVSYVFLHAFSLHRESPDLDPGRRTLISRGGGLCQTTGVNKVTYPLPKPRPGDARLSSSNHMATTQILLGHQGRINQV
jgi:hypothetical protein